MIVDVTCILQLRQTGRIKEIRSRGCHIMIVDVTCILRLRETGRIIKEIRSSGMIGPLVQVVSEQTPWRLARARIDDDFGLMEARVVFYVVITANVLKRHRE